MFKKIKDLYKAWKFKHELDKIQRTATVVYIERRICPVQKKKVKKNVKRK